MSRGKTWEFTSLLYGSIEVRTKTGDLVFSMKRKGEKGNEYYLYELHEDKMDTETLPKFQKMWPMLKLLAARFGYALFNFGEVEARIKECIKANEFGDAAIDVLDEATGKSCKLTIGLTKRYFDEMTKEEKELVGNQVPGVELRP